MQTTLRKQARPARTVQRRAWLAHLHKILHRDGALHLMLVIPVLIVFIYNYLPMPGLIMAFEKYKPSLGLLHSEWVGVENFQTLFATAGFIRAVVNTVVISVQKIVLLVIVPVTFSLLLNEMKSIFVRRLVQTIVYLPYFISWVIMSGIIIQILSPSTGIINKALDYVGIKPIFFLGKSEWFRPTIIATSIWKNFGYSTIVFLAALSSVDPALHEAATIEGAGHWKRMWHITLPCIMPTIILVLSLQIGNILNAGFDQIFNLLSSASMDTGDIIDTLVYRYGIQSAQYSIATAAGLFKSTISAVLMVLSYWLAYKSTGYRLF